ncbi:hypothetical protein Vretifemale_3175 [Volvox reticuliferus]|uniref:RING-type E3 ubiquitin transferase n=1 Tax=Volvox reticuliferus TaxID=1737510 RepID=A0A8J4FFS3_9CHLO|nr:hypothetical protein Vretifemale_3175 [Volvox reticuliferus]
MEWFTAAMHWYVTLLPKCSSIIQPFPTDIAQLEHMLPLLVAVRGRITCREPTTCQLNGASAVMRELVEEEVYFKEHPSGRTTQECFEVRREQEQREAFLEDRTGSIRLENLEHAAGLPGVMEVKQEFRHADLLQGTLLQAVLSKALKSMVRHGVRITERYLPADMTVTVVGELVADCVGSSVLGSRAAGPVAANSNQLTSQQQQQPSGSDRSPAAILAARPAAAGRDSALGTNVASAGNVSATATAVVAAGAELLGQAALQALPYTLRMPGRGPFHVTTLTLPQLRTSLERTSSIIRVFAWGFGLLGAVLVVRKAAHAYQRLQTHRRFKRLLASRGDNDEGDGVRGPGTCVVCLDRDSDIVFSGCGHMCVCNACSVNLQKCPICRVASRTIRVFRP